VHGKKGNQGGALGRGPDRAKMRCHQKKRNLNRGGVDPGSRNIFCAPRRQARKVEKRGAIAEKKIVSKYKTSKKFKLLGKRTERANEHSNLGMGVRTERDTHERGEGNGS